MQEESAIAIELERIAQEFVEATRYANNQLPRQLHDVEWPSQCIVSANDDGTVDWKPVKRDDAVGFYGLEHALEMTFPQEFKQFFNVFWSASIPVRWGRREFELLQLWNEEDENNLLHNLLGHIVETKRVRQSPTLFFALIDDHRFLSCEVATGAVMLEELSGPRPQQLDNNLLDFLRCLRGRAMEKVTEDGH